MLSVGFTGTRKGMTGTQSAHFRTILAGLALANRYGEFHHGDCEGADAEAHDLVRQLCPDWTIHIHPGPEGDPHRAHRTGDKAHPPKTHFARNRDIVRASSLIIGVSKAPHRLERGGTWYTLDFAVKSKVPTKVLWPDGVADLYVR
jgi:hypothetical protein